MPIVAVYNSQSEINDVTQNGRKIKILEVKRILERETDEDNKLTATQIGKRLEKIGFTITDRKGIYDDINTLNFFYKRAEGDNASFFVEKDPESFGYYLDVRLFTIADLKLIIDILQSSKFLSETKTKELIRALETLCSEHQAKKLNHDVVIANRVKNMNKSVLTNVDNLNYAIENDYQISFRYAHFDVKLQRVYNKNTTVVSPLFLVYSDDNYYLVAFDEKKQKAMNYRVDRMAYIRPLTSKPRLGTETFTKEQRARYQQYTFGMYGGGEPQLVKLRVQNSRMDAIIDKFGLNIYPKAVDKDHFEVMVKVVLSPQFYAWVFGLKNYITIVDEEMNKEARQGMIEHLKAVMKRYE